MKYVFEDFNIEDRKSKVMFSAPHCFPQLRNGEIKSAEPKTSVLIETLSKDFNCSCIYKTKFYNNDPNWDENSTYKEQLADFILKNNVKLLFDLHSMYYKRPVDVCVGINSGKNILNKYDISDMIVESFKATGLKTVLVDSPFSAANPNTVSAYISNKCTIPCFQLELNNRLLLLDYKNDDSSVVYNGFKNIFNNIDNFI